MGKLLLVLCVVSLSFMGIGTAVIPTDAMFWLASGALLYQKIRFLLILLLLLQFITNPPRQLWIRTFTGLTAGVIGVWTIQATYTMSMPALDTFAFLSASIILLVTALERKITLAPTYNIAGQNGLETSA